MKKILFICTGNTCRSVMAEALGRLWLKENGLEDVEISSAGLAALPNMSAAPQAAEVMQKRGLNVENHSSKLLDVSVIEEAEIVFVMTHAHLDQLLTYYPEAEAKVKLISKNDIPDPFGGTVEEYEKCALQLEEAINKALQEWTSSGRN